MKVAGDAVAGDAVAAAEKAATRNYFPREWEGYKLSRTVHIFPYYPVGSSSHSTLSLPLHF